MKCFGILYSEVGAFFHNQYSYYLIVAILFDWYIFQIDI